MIFVKEVQPEKQPFPKDVTDDGIMIFGKEEQL